MSIFNITDVTSAGAFVNAVTAAKDCDRQNTGRHFHSSAYWQPKALGPADKTLRAMATEEAAGSGQGRMRRVSPPWRESIACVMILAVVGIVMF